MGHSRCFALGTMTSGLSQQAHILRAVLGSVSRVRALNNRYLAPTAAAPASTRRVIFRSAGAAVEPAHVLIAPDEADQEFGTLSGT